jgi:signal transduction histidine kinase
VLKSWGELTGIGHASSPLRSAGDADRAVTRVVEHIGGASLRRVLEFDVAFAIAAFVALLVDPVVSNEISELSPLAYVLAFLTALPLAQRRRFPLGTLAVVVPLLLASLAVFRPNHAAVGILVLLVFTVALESGRHRSLMMGSLMAVVVVVAVIANAHHPSAVDVFAYLTPIVGAIFAGQALRARQELAKTIVEDAAREREAAAQHRFDEERLSWAHEAHDVVGHALVAVNVRAAAAARRERQAGRDNDTTSALDDIAAASAEALEELRGTLKVLRAISQEAVPLHAGAVLADVPALAERAESAGLQVELDAAGDLSNLAASYGHTGYRIVQEALTNVLNHSAARHAVVRLRVDDDQVLIEVSDDGPPKAAVSSGGHGLLGMAERAAALGGTCEAGPAADGWRVRVSLPLAPRPVV